MLDVVGRLLNQLLQYLVVDRHYEDVLNLKPVYTSTRTMSAR